MSSEQLKKFSDELKTAREDCNLTLQMLNQKTRIDVKFLQAIEEGDFHIIDDVYVRAFIRGYAKNVGLDETATLKKYSLAQEGKYLDSNQTDAEDGESQLDDEKKVVFTSEYVKVPVQDANSSKKFDKRFIILGSILIAVTAAIYYFFIAGSSNTIVKESSPINLTNNTPTQTNTERFEVVEPEVTQKISIPKTDSLALTINANARTWLRALIDESKQVEFTLNANDSKKILAANKFKLLIGNAGGISLQLNGNAIELQGNVGDIKNVEIDSTGIRYLKINTERSNVPD